MTWRKIIIWSSIAALIALVLIPAEVVRQLPTSEDTSGGLQLRVRPRGFLSSDFAAEVVNISASPLTTASDYFDVSTNSNPTESRIIDGGSKRVLKPGEGRTGTVSMPSVHPGSFGFQQFYVRYEDVYTGPCWKTVWTFEVLGKRLAVK